MTPWLADPDVTLSEPMEITHAGAIAASRLGRSSVLIEQDADYCRIAADRLSQLSLLAGPTA